MSRLPLIEAAVRSIEVIVEVVDERAIAACLPVIRRAFRTVMDDMGLTENDVPTNAAFLTPDTLRTLRAGGTRTFALVESGRPVGCVSPRPASRPGVLDLERLAVAPEARHSGHGTALMDHAFAVARAEGATVVSIGIIEENTVLKRWYEAYGFVARGTRTFDHLPFTVCVDSRVRLHGCPSSSARAALISLRDRGEGRFTRSSAW